MFHVDVYKRQLSALTDEQKAEMAKASDQLGALIVSADASVVDAATGENAAHEGKLSCLLYTSRCV